MAIATLYDGSEQYRCALPLWCATATELRTIIPASEIMILSPAAPGECPPARWVWGEVGREVHEAAARYLAAHHIGGTWAYLKQPVLLKLALLGMTQYSLLVFIDLDSDCNPRGRYPHSHLTLAQWQSAIPQFMASRALFVGSPDHSAPVRW